MEQYAFRYVPTYGTHHFRSLPGTEQYSSKNLARWYVNGPKGTYGMGKLIKTDVQKILNPGPILRQNAYSTRAYKTPKPSTLELEDASRLPRGGLVMRVLGSSGVDGGTAVDPHSPDIPDEIMTEAEALLEGRAKAYYQSFPFRMRQPTPPNSSQTSDLTSRRSSLLSSEGFADIAMQSDRESVVSSGLLDAFGGNGLNLQTEPMETIPEIPKAPESTSTAMDRQNRMRDTFSSGLLSAEVLQSQKASLKKAESSGRTKKESKGIVTEEALQNRKASLKRTPYEIPRTVKKSKPSTVGDVLRDAVVKRRKDMMEID